MSEIRTHEQVVGIVCTLAAEAHNDCEQEREEYGTQTRQAMRWLEDTDLALRAALAEAEKERDALRERLDQFDAYGMPNVAAALDRIESAESALAEAVGVLREIAALGVSPEYGDGDKPSMVCDACACHIDKYPHDDRCPAELARTFIARIDGGKP